MKNIKTIKLLATSLIGASTIVLSANLISCHKSEITNSWDSFKTAARHETASNIVSVANPADWVSTDNLNITDTHADDDKQTVIISITRLKDNIIATAVFTIQYHNNDKYNVSGWKCSANPKDDEWSAFQEAAQHESPDALLAQIAPWQDKTTYKWTFGIFGQITWAKTDKAEWDVYGANSKTDIYQGMNGKPHFDNDAKTMTAVISKKSAKGGYDADPIQVVIKYTAGIKYDIKNWKPTKLEQLQSLDTVTSFWQDSINLISSNASSGWNAFGNKNWMTLKGSASANNHIDSALAKNVLTNAYHVTSDIQIYDNNNKITPMANGEGKTFQIGIEFTADQNSHHINLDFDYLFANKHDQAKGGNAFNYTWVGNVEY